MSCTEPCWDGLIEEIGEAVEAVGPTSARNGDIHRYFARQPPMRTRVQRDADGFGPHASTVVFAQGTELGWLPGVAAGNMREDSLIGKPGVDLSRAGWCLSILPERVGGIVLRGRQRDWFRPVAGRSSPVRLFVCSNTQ